MSALINRLFTSPILVRASVLFVPPSLQAVTIDLVAISNAGHAPDTRNDNINGVSVGSVASPYEIREYEVTAGRYKEFLNAVADLPASLTNNH